MELLSLIIDGAMASAIIFAVIQIKINKKQLNLSVIVKCINDFRSLDNFDINTTDKVLINKYIDLVNEELFYMQRGYLPEDIIREWLDGIIDYIPITHIKSNSILNPNNSVNFINSNSKLLDLYPRIKLTFIISKNYNFDVIYDNENLIERVKERKKLIDELLKNLKKFDLYD